MNKGDRDEEGIFNRFFAFVYVFNFREMERRREGDNEDSGIRSWV